jgi:hypothetical protein
MADEDDVLGVAQRVDDRAGVLGEPGVGIVLRQVRRDRVPEQRDQPLPAAVVVPRAVNQRERAGRIREAILRSEPAWRRRSRLPRRIAYQR